MAKGKGVKGNGVDRDKQKFLALTARVDSAGQKLDDARGEVGGLYAQAEKDGYHRKALKDALKLRDMEADKRNDYLANLNLYCDWLGVFDQGELLSGAPRPPQSMARSREAVSDAPRGNTAPDAGPPKRKRGNGKHPNVDGDAEAHELAASSNEPTGGYTFETGKQAGLAGQTAADNPWPPGSNPARAWERGRQSAGEQAGASIADLVTRGQAAQKAVDQVIANATRKGRGRRRKEDDIPPEAAD